MPHRTATAILCSAVLALSACRVLWRAADCTAAPDFAYGKGGATDWTDVAAAAEHWSLLFRDFLDNNLGN